jgi:hypothetical protein
MSSYTVYIVTTVLSTGELLLSCLFLMFINVAANADVTKGIIKGG